MRLRSRARLLALSLVIALAGCGGTSQKDTLDQAASQPEPTQTQPSEATTAEAGEEVTTEAGNAKAEVPDRRGDTKAPDLDIIRGTVGRDGDTVRITITLAQEPTDDVIYSAFLTCADGEELWQLAYKRAAGTTTIFAFDAGGSAQQYEAEGELSGRTVAVAYPSTDMGCDGPAIDFQLVAEGTNDRDPMTDYVPEPGPDPLNPKQIRIP